MSNLSEREESEVKPRTPDALDETLASDDGLADSEKTYEIIVAGGENKKSVEHILLPATLPKEKNFVTRGLNTLWSAILNSKSSENPQCKKNEASSVGKWSYLKPMKTRRMACMTAIYQDHMFAFGGINTGQSMEILELNNERARWQYHRDTFPDYVYASAAAVYGNNAYIFGGNIGDAASANVYRFSLVPPYSVDLIGQMPERRYYHNAEIFDDKVILICGSSTGFSNSMVDTVLQYDITNNSFKTLPPSPVKVLYAATATWKDNVIIVGGQDEQYRDLNSVWMYNVSSGEHQKLRPMKHKRHSCAAVAAGDMMVVMGGQNSRESAMVSAECYNFQTNKWTELPPMKQTRRYPSAVIRCRAAKTPEEATSNKAPQIES